MAVVGGGPMARNGRDPIAVSQREITRAWEQSLSLHTPSALGA